MTTLLSVAIAVLVAAIVALLLVVLFSKKPIKTAAVNHQ